MAERLETARDRRRIAGSRTADRLKTAGDVLMSMLGVVVFIAMVPTLATAMLSIRPTDPAAARAWDARRAQEAATAERAERTRLMDVRTTIVGNMPGECRDRVDMSLPKAPPASEAAMLATVERLCPQSFDDE